MAPPKVHQSPSKSVNDSEIPTPGSVSGILRRMSDDLRTIKQLTERIGRLLHGHPPTVQGAVLADLLAMWLAGHMSETEADTTGLREMLLSSHIEVVRKLVPVNAAGILERLKRH